MDIISPQLFGTNRALPVILLALKTDAASFGLAFSFIFNVQSTQLPRQGVGLTSGNGYIVKPGGAVRENRARQSDRFQLL